jgi:methionyl-tRNA synthetase
MITFKDFEKLDIRIGKIVSVEKVPDTDKLLKFVFDIGGEERQIIAGMREFFPDESILVGKEMPILVNIEPREFRGEKSEGMIIATDLDDKPVFIVPEKKVPPGTPVR